MPRCPACKTQALPIEYEGMRIYHCGDCGGHWLSPGRLDVILARRNVEMPEAVRQAFMDLAERLNRPQKLWCMTCGVEMLKEPFRFWDDIQIDRCPKCNGVWLDCGELEKCQIYWEYMIDHPDEWTRQDAYVRKALLETQLDMRKPTPKSNASIAMFARMLRPL
ncbi:MAG: zf-TFIIB domain-containing protein [Phycisphaerae bacterium]